MRNATAIALRQAVQDDASLLAEIRVEAMRDNLEALGRYDPQRASSPALLSPIRR